MKTMTCKQLGGACDMQFHANTFEEIAALSKQHAMEMFEKGDVAHRRAMHEMQAHMISHEMMSMWFEGKRNEFQALPENK